MRTDKQWIKWGSSDPYYAVTSDKKHFLSEFTEDGKQEFFRSGENRIEYLLGMISDIYNVSGFKSALDFGSGVGRLVIPLARNADRVVGVDISTAMIAEAEKNCERFGISNATFFESDDAISRVHDRFDLVDSQVVLQHIPWSRGRKIVERLGDMVNQDGVIAIQFLSRCNAPWFIRLLVRLRYQIPPIQWIRNLAHGHRVFLPPMEVHAYPLGEVLHILDDKGFGKYVLMTDRTTVRDFDSVTLLAIRGQG